ncbi:hypothetical protein MLD38_015760 [Melastoma candidum]|uniref:Uncharacterized protein n=1 Tax=Melastoma candidum TaxID=119954 RepID=A0ACB9RII7_9MYRT|nr:hypothetical protein MLD38_015760 [Melastoma candidum]
MRTLRAARSLCPLWKPRAFASRSGKSAMDMAARDGELRVFVVAGEVSGDRMGGRLMSSLKRLSPFPVLFSGVGGSMMLSEGLRSLFPMEDISVMGIWELLPHLGRIRGKLKETEEAAVQFEPHVVVTIDSKGFSFRLLKQLRARMSEPSLGGPMHFHYVAPSFWAWKGGEERLRNLAKFVDHVFCILPNEAEVCQLNGLDASFVGHPVLEDILDMDEAIDASCDYWNIPGDGQRFRSACQIHSGATIMSLLPGSRLQEVTRMLPIFAKTINMLKHAFPELLTVIHVAPNKHVESHIDVVMKDWPVSFFLISGENTMLKYDAFQASQVALCTSGTVAVEMQLAKLPCVVAYRAHFLTEWYIRYKAKIPYISLPNILTESAAIPEALFNKCTPENIAAKLELLIHDECSREKQTSTAKKVMKLLSPSKEVLCKSAAHWGSKHFYGSPSEIAASMVLNYVKAS